VCLFVWVFACVFACLLFCLFAQEYNNDSISWILSRIWAKVAEAKYKSLNKKDRSSNLFVCSFVRLLVCLIVCVLVCLCVCVFVCLCVFVCFACFSCVGHIWRLPLKVHMYWLSAQVSCAGVPPLNTLQLGTVPQYCRLQGPLSRFSLYWTV